MTPEQWQKVKSVLEKAVEIEPASRSAYLAEVCAGDTDFRREVESFLDYEYTIADALEQNAFAAVMQNGFNANAKNFIGRQIGNYKLTDNLGAGGMGTVFLGERADGAFTQKIALKIVKRGMDSEAVLRRFFKERQILAQLEHPNIAHLVDGGTTDEGLPYFVMEYVDGANVLNYAEAENLDLDQRLELFRQICVAVSYAHQNLVIHRDLKPSNILITKDRKVKLLDFGIAKLLKSETGETATQQFVFTPEYASPEQMCGEKLTTATDVYSLGVILFELLTGSRPYKTSSQTIGEIIKAVCETEPVKPSSVQSSKFKVQSSKFKNQTRQNKAHTADEERKPANPTSDFRNSNSLRGDLDNIILKALRKEPERRYSSVEQFAEDIRRQQAGLPVSASKDTWNYRASKFLKRNKLPMAAASLILLTLLGGMAATMYQASVARRERARAEQRFNDVRRLANSFLFEINEEIQKSPIKARELLVARALEYLDKLAAEAGNDAELQSELAGAYEKIGNIESELFSPNAGKSSDALASHQKSLAIRENLFRAEPENINRGLDAIKSRIFVGDILLMSGKVAEAADNYRQSVAIHEKLLALDAKSYAVRRSLAMNYARLGQSILRSGSLGDALADYENALALYSELSAENSQDLYLKRSLSMIYSYIGYVKIEAGNYGEAVRFFSSSLELTEKFSPDINANRESQNDLSNAHLWLGIAFSENSEFDKSLAEIRRARSSNENLRSRQKQFRSQKLARRLLSGTRQSVIKKSRVEKKSFAKRRAGNERSDQGISNCYRKLRSRVASRSRKSVGAKTNQFYAPLSGRRAGNARRNAKIAGNVQANAR